MYNSPYFNQLASVDRIDAQIQELQRQRAQVQQMNTQPSINQTFQLAPNNTQMKMVDSIDDVKKELVFGDTPFFSKDMRMVWLKNAKGDIKSYELNEIIQKDEKDLMIDNLKLEIERLKENEQSNVKYNDEPIKVKEPTTSTANRKFNK